MRSTSWSARTSASTARAQEDPARRPAGQVPRPRRLRASTCLIEPSQDLPDVARARAHLFATIAGTRLIALTTRRCVRALPSWRASECWNGWSIARARDQRGYKLMRGALSLSLPAASPMVRARAARLQQRNDAVHKREAAAPRPRARPRPCRVDARRASRTVSRDAGENRSALRRPRGASSTPPTRTRRASAGAHARRGRAARMPSGAPVGSPG